MGPGTGDPKRGHLFDGDHRLFRRRCKKSDKVSTVILFMFDPSLFSGVPDPGKAPPLTETCRLAEISTGVYRTTLEKGVPYPSTGKIKRVSGSFVTNVRCVGFLLNFGLYTLLEFHNKKFYYPRLPCDVKPNTKPGVPYCKRGPV